MKPNIIFRIKNIPSGRMLSLTLMLLLLTSLISCSRQYYQTNTRHLIIADTLEWLNTAKKVFIVHTPEGSFPLKNVQLNNECLCGERDLLDTKYSRFLHPNGEKANYLGKKYMDVVFNEVHLYTNRTFDEDSRINLDILQISRMDVYGPDYTARRDSGILGIVFGTSLVSSIAGGAVIHY